MEVLFTLHPASPSGDILRNYIIYQNQENDISTIHKAYLDFTERTAQLRLHGGWSKMLLPNLSFPPLGVKFVLWPNSSPNLP